MIAVAGIAGCAAQPHWTTTPYGTMTYSRNEVERLPAVSIRKILSSASESENTRVQILVAAKGLDGACEVKSLAGPEEVIVTNERGQEAKIRITDITKIERIRRVKTAPRKKSAGEKVEGAAEVAVYAPFLPLVAARPVFGLMGLDEGKNA
ncbi:MAG: hypothetical protein D6815_08675, partial [Candidatus Dadabacteria bacterium]